MTDFLVRVFSLVSIEYVNTDDPVVLVTAPGVLSSMKRNLSSTVLVC